MCRLTIELTGAGRTAEVPEDPFNERRLLDAGDDAQPAAALPAGLDVDGEHAVVSRQMGGSEEQPRWPQPACRATFPKCRATNVPGPAAPSSAQAKPALSPTETGALSSSTRPF